MVEIKFLSGLRLKVKSFSNKFYVYLDRYFFIAELKELEKYGFHILTIFIQTRGLETEYRGILEVKPDRAG